ncbi:MAG: HAD family hydrolase [Candidatus Helarchaeota archaeon]|nr:HAD family hydrolase [Candidatus Helarchaeota archaeon]
MVLITTKIKCIGFDLYSTLVNTDNHNWNEMIKVVFPIIQNLGYKGSFDSFLKIQNEVYWKWRDYREKNHVEVDNRIWWRETLEKLKIKFNESDISQIIIKSHNKWRTQIKLYPKVKELLSDLKKHYKLALISNISTGDLSRGDMKVFGIFDIFDIVVMSSDLEIRKPSPKIFEYVLEKLNIKKEEMIFVGDTLYDDIQGAKNVGLSMAIHIKRKRSYFFPDYYIEPDKTIHNLHEIKGILNEI